MYSKNIKVSIIHKPYIILINTIRIGVLDNTINTIRIGVLPYVFDSFACLLDIRCKTRC